MARKPTTLPVKESDLVKGIYDGLTLRGRIVLRCGQWRADRAGSDPGLPDLFVWYDDGYHKYWIGLEVKTATGRLSDAQKMLAHLGCVIVVRSIEEAFAAVAEPPLQP